MKATQARLSIRFKGRKFDKFLRYQINFNRGLNLQANSYPDMGL